MAKSLALVAIAASLAARAQGERLFSLEARNVRCENVEVPLELQPLIQDPNKIIDLYGLVFLDSRKNERTSTNFWENAQTKEWIGGNGQYQYEWSGSNLAVDKNILSFEIANYGTRTDTNRKEKLTTGWVNITLPNVSELVDKGDGNFYDEQFYGGGWGMYGQEQKLDIIYKGEKYGTCTIQLRLMASICEPGEYVSDLRGPCVGCAAGYQCNGRNTYKCGKGKYSQALADTCENCEAGYFCPNEGSDSARQNACPAGKWSGAGSSECNFCIAGYYGKGKNVDATCDGKCSAGYKCVAGSTSATAEQCPAGQYSTEGSSECSNCAKGYYGDGKEPAVSETCDGKCAAGYKCAAGSTSAEAEQCPAGEYSPEGSSECSVCAAGYYGSGQKPAVSETCDGICPAGYSCQAGSTSAKGEQCAAGHYSTEGSSICLKCAAGFYGSGTKIATNEKCDGACEAGFICEEGSTSATPSTCPDGKYFKDGKCSYCKAGHYGIPGTAYSNETCAGPCEAGYICEKGSTDPKQKNCTDDGAVAFYCPPGSERAKTVSDGYRTVSSSTDESSATNRARQELCQTGHYCLLGAQHPCPAGSYQDEEGAMECKPCGCAEDEFIQECTEKKNICMGCSVTKANRATECDALTVFIACDGEADHDNHVCLSCTNYTATNTSAANMTLPTNATISEDEERFQEACANLNQSINQNISNGLPAWVIAVVAVGVALVFIIIIGLIVRQRRAMRHELEEATRKNKSFEDEQDLAVSLENNVNPMFAKQKVVPPNNAESDKLHEQEVKEINKHKRALEKEVRRLKQEVQVKEVATSSATRANKPKKKKKEFAGSMDLDLQ